MIDEPSPAENPERRPSRRGPTVVELDLTSLVFVALGIVAALLTLQFLRASADAVAPVVVGGVLALALDPVVGAVRDRLEVRRPIAVLLVAVVGAALVTVVLIVLGPPAVDQARELRRDVRTTVEESYELPVIGSFLADRDAAATAEEWVTDLPARVTDETVATTIERVLDGAATAVTVLVLAMALLLDGEHLVRRTRRLVPVRHRARADAVAGVFYRVVGRYFGGSLTVAALMGTYVLALSLLFGVPLAPLAAFWAMITDLVPQIGGFLGGALLGILAVTVSVGTAVVVVGLFVLYMNFENHVLQPAIVGDAVDLTPPTTMLAALIGGSAAGVAGALVATPLVGAAKQLYLEFRFGPAAHTERQRPTILGRVRSLAGRLRPGGR
ncbi:MAG: AI-2E family transporter [Actinomycetota bacterium]|nr:AI-2E family transporter [Actinomycetota bacterium]